MTLVRYCSVMEGVRIEDRRDDVVDPAMLPPMGTEVRADVAARLVDSMALDVAHLEHGGKPFSLRVCIALVPAPRLWSLS